MSIARRVGAVLPPRLSRRIGRWFIAGPRRRRVYDALNRSSAAPTRITHGPLRGLTFVGGETVGYALGVSEPAVQDALVTHLGPGGVLYDIGANVGFLSLLGAKLVGPTGRVICFEPLPAALRLLRANLDRNGMANYEVIAAAVGDSSGTARLATDRGSLTASLAEDATTSVAVQLVTLDELDLPAPTVVKIDVEGAESRVLRGMPELLRSQRPVLIIEIHGDQLAPVSELLAAAGYRARVLNDDGMPHLIATPAEGPRAEEPDELSAARRSSS